MGWETFETERSFFTYISNKNYDLITTSTTQKHCDTGWHLIPNQWIYQTLKNREVEHIVQKYSRIKPVKQTVLMGHGIPLSSVKAISDKQGEIIAFNNTLYMLIYHDVHNVTRHQTNKDNIIHSEGESYKSGTIATQILKKYQHPIALNNVQHNFDPFQDPQNVKILYAGNNGCQIEWNVQEEDAGKYWSFATIPHHWYRSENDQTIPTLPILKEITPCNNDPTIAIKEELRWTHGCLNNGIKFRNPINNILIKVLPIASPSTNCQLPHYCKLWIQIKQTWQGIQRDDKIPMSTHLHMYDLITMGHGTNSQAYASHESYCISEEASDSVKKAWQSSKSSTIGSIPLETDPVSKNKERQFKRKKTEATEVEHVDRTYEISNQGLQNIQPPIDEETCPKNL